MGLNKRNKWIISAAVGLIITGIVSYNLYKNVVSYETKHMVAENPEKAVKQAAKIDEIKFKTGLTESSTEDEVLSVMNKMCHQKIEADDKWGAIPMNPDTINAVYKIVEASEFPHREDLLEILMKWKNSDFSSVDDDHNFILGLQGGTVGVATGIAAPEEEAEYVLLNFGSKLK